MDDVEVLDPLPAVVLGSTRVLIDASRPVAALVGADGSAQVVTWPDAPLPARSASGHTLAAERCVWVIYSPDFPENDPAPTATAVRIGADARVATCDLGSLEVIGVDEEGVWVTAHPYLAMGIGPGHDQAGIGREPPQPPAWIEQVPVVSWEDFERDQEQAGRADVEAAMAEAAAGGQAAGGWFAFSPDAVGQPPLAPAPAPVPTGAAVLRRVRANGGIDEVAVSRVVSQVISPAPGVLRLVFHPTGAVITNTPDGHGRTYDYPRRAAVVDVSAGLPAHVDLDALQAQPAADELPAWLPRQAGDDVDLRAVPGTRWSLRHPGQDAVDSAIQEAYDQYAGLDAPHVVHTRRDDRWHRVHSQYSDLSVRAAGQWPATEVIADFTFHTHPDHRLRRRTRVFDDAGLPIANPYLAAHLNEALVEADLAELPVREGRSEI